VSPLGSELAGDRDELRALRELYDALMAARPYVDRETDPLDALLIGAKPHEAVATLERVDAALADAGELLAGVTS
jgi:hypothetical protein